MKKIITCLLLAGIFTSCVQNMVTGRKQLALVSETELQSMAKTEYQTFLSANKVVNVNSNKDAEMVRRVGSRIAAAIKAFYDKTVSNPYWKDTSGNLTWLTIKK